MGKVLVVEDDTTLNKAYAMILSKQGHEVTVAHNGQEALDAAAKAEPDVILLDLLMPVMGGITFLEKYDLSQHKKCRVVILSNIGDEKEISKAMELGAYKYIVKSHATPIQLATLVDKLTQQNLFKK